MMGESGLYTLFWVECNPKQVRSATFDSFNMAHSAFSQKPTASRVLVDANWAIKQSKSCSKKNKTDLKKIKEHIATLKRDGTHGLG